MHPLAPGGLSQRSFAIVRFSLDVQNMGMSEALIGFLGVVVGLAVASARRGSPTELAALSRSLDSLTVLLSGGGREHGS